MRNCFPPVIVKVRLIVVAALLPFFGSVANSQISVTEAPPAAAQDVVRVAFTLAGPHLAAGKVRLKLNGPVDAVTSNEIQPPAAGGEYVISVRLFKGANTLTVIGFNGASPEPLTSWGVTCAGRWCSDPFTLTSANVAVSGAAAAVVAPPAPVAGLAIASPLPNATYQDETFIPITINVTDQTIKKVYVRVLNKGKPLNQAQNSYVVEKKDDGTLKPIKTKIRIGPNANDISAFDADVGVAGVNTQTIQITCNGDQCGTENDVASVITNSQNMRAIVGMEQAGASSTTSETKPFIDFFFTAPLRLNKSQVPRLASWGNIRIASTPDQITSTGIFPTNLVNQISQTGNSGSLVQSFDFLAGLEARLFTANGSFLSVIPGVRQKTRFYLAGGGGAISPLTAKRENAQIFKIPKPGDPQYDLFVERYGTPPAGKEFVAFVPLDRDRFLRQWYAGIRLKTYFCEDDECTRFRNSFPGIFDVMIGQNEAATGGSRKYGGFPDPTDNTRILGEKNAYVLRIDGFYPLPFREASFLYLYGTAMMKIGGGRTKIINPLFLDPATSLITDPKVFIPPADLQQLLQPNRDYYKIGIGVNLTDLFNRRTSPQ